MWKKVKARLIDIFEPGPPDVVLPIEVPLEKVKKIVEVRQIGNMKHRTSAVVATRMLLSLIFAAVCWPRAGGWLLVLWLAFNLMHTLASMKSTDDYFSSPNPAKDIKFWKNRSLQMTAVAALSWGFAGYFFMMPGQPVEQLMLLGMIVAVAFGSVPLYAYWLPSLWVFLPCILIPPIIRMVIIYDINWGLAVISTFFIVLAIIYFGARLNRIFTQSIYRELEREHLMEQLVQQRQSADFAREAAEMAILARTKFFAGANHDLRQPLQAMGIFISLLENQVDDKSRPLVENLSKACKSVSTLVEQILEISRLDSGSVKLNRSTFQIDQLFSDLENEFRPLAAAKGVAFEVRSFNGAVNTDEVLLGRALRNLLGNAIRYTRAGKIMLTARKIDQDRVSIGVWDTGAGITKEESKQIFKEFFRGKSGQEAKEGFGLGLSIVRKIAEVLSFKLSLSSRVGKGTVFRLEMPLVSDVLANATVVVRKPKEIQSLKGIKILLIEDEEIVRESMIELMKGWGAQVISAETYSADLAAQIVRESPVNMIVTDFNLGQGKLTGLQSIFRIRSAMGKKIPAILSTAVPRDVVLEQYEEETEGVDFSEAGANLLELPLLLQKPVSPSELNRAIASLRGSSED